MISDIDVYFMNLSCKFQSENKAKDNSFRHLQIIYLSS